MTSNSTMSILEVWTQWRCRTSKKARELILGICLGAKTRFLSFNRIQPRAVTGLLTGHNTLRRHLHIMGLSDSPLSRRCGAICNMCTCIYCAFVLFCLCIFILFTFLFNFVSYVFLLLCLCILMVS